MYTGVATAESQIARLRRALTRTRQGSNVVLVHVSPGVDTRARLSWTVAVYVLFCQEQVRSTIARSVFHPYKLAIARVRMRVYRTLSSYIQTLDSCFFQVQIITLV